MLPLYRSHPIGLFCKPMGWLQCNDHTGKVDEWLKKSQSLDISYCF